MSVRVPVIQTDKNTFLHRRDARAKVVLLVLSFAFILVAPDVEWYAGYALVGALVTAVARVPLKWLGVVAIAQIPNIIGLITLPILFTLIFSGTVTWSGTIELGVTLSLAWIGALLFSLGLFSTMSVAQLTDGLRGLRLPEIVAFGLQYAFLLLYTSLSDILRIIDAMKLKGMRLETKNPLPWIKALPRLMIPATFTIIRRASSMMGVLQLRGYTFRGRRQLVALQGFGIADAGIVLLGAALWSATLAANLAG